MPEKPDDKPQIDKFRDLARELGADEDEERFEETVRQIAPKGETCRYCQGSGKVPKAQDCIPAAYPPEVEYGPCPECRGTGRV